MKLDVCIIATVRPEVLRMTLASFCNKFLHQFDCRAIINVDPAGDTAKHTQQDVVAIAQEFFHKVVANTPATLFRIEQDIAHGKSLIAEWLPKYKFRNWKKTATQEKPVSAKMREARAADQHRGNLPAGRRRDQPSAVG